MITDREKARIAYDCLSVRGDATAVLRFRRVYGEGPADFLLRYVVMLEAICDALIEKVPA